MEKNRKAEEAVKEWLEENGYDYEVKTYLPGGDAGECVRKNKDIISIPAGVEDVDEFMEQFVKSFWEINGITELKRMPEGRAAQQEKKELFSFEAEKLSWVNEPSDYKIGSKEIIIRTEPGTDLWQRTYYHFRNDNAPVLQMETEEKYFSFVVKTDFTDSHHRFDQCGIVMYLDSENWLKASVEYENEEYQHLGSVVTNNGYSDWATTAIGASIKTMWYRFSRREDDYCIECSTDGVTFSQMRICHMHNGKGKIRFGIYACSPEESSFKAVFSNMQVMECQWRAHDGQQPDSNG